MANETSRKVPAPPWSIEDETWFFEHYADIAQQYPGQWVAIRNQRVVAYYHSAEQRWLPVADEVLTSDPSEDCLTFFVERDVRVYGRGL